MDNGDIDLKCENKVIIEESVLRERAIRFSNSHKDYSQEEGQKQTFWNNFFKIFGLERSEHAVFECPVKNIDGQTEFMDLFWKKTLLVEHKTLNSEDLNTTMKRQSLRYYSNLESNVQPRYLIACDFQNWFLLDKYDNSKYWFKLSELVDNLGLFGFMTDRPKTVQVHPVNIEASTMMGQIFDKLQESNYGSGQASYFLTRLVFCLFADHTGIFGDRSKFQAYLKKYTSENGSDMWSTIEYLFKIFNQHKDKRDKTITPILNSFPYINGELFSKKIELPIFNKELRDLVLKAGNHDWSKVSPAIFGNMFQTVMDQEQRREQGAHYTSEENILKLIGPLFLDELENEFDSLDMVEDDTRKNRFIEFQNKLSNLKFLDPACGSGNFLIIAYREIRRLEHRTIHKIYKNDEKKLHVDKLSKIDVDQFHGIEKIEFSARIAEVSLWMMDHIMNLELSEKYGINMRRIPIKKKPNIVCCDALDFDWNELLPSSECNYVFGNPPFSGARQMLKEQKEQTVKITGSKNLDYVTNWFVKAIEYIPTHTHTHTHTHTDPQIAFVSTNSITQGEQVNLLFPQIFRNGFEISFAYKSFKWESESKGKAQVTVVIIGLVKNNKNKKRLFYNKNEKLIEKNPQTIAPHLRETCDKQIIVKQVSKPINNLPEIHMGSNPVDNGNYIFSDSEKDEFLKTEPNAEKWIIPYYSGADFLHNTSRHILALQTIKPHELKKLPQVMKRVKAVKKFRLENKSETTRRYAEKPTEFYQTHIPKKPFLAIPQVSSENRKYVPMAFMKLPTITSIQLYHIEDATIELFGLLESKMHMLWLSSFSGKLETRLRYSANRVYNTFPVPQDYTLLRPFAQKILDIREKNAESTLVDLYNSIRMPSDLLKAHQSLDKAVEKLYRTKQFKTDDERLDFLLEEYQKMIGTQTTL